MPRASGSKDLDTFFDTPSLADCDQVSRRADKETDGLSWQRLQIIGFEKVTAVIVIRDTALPIRQPHVDHVSSFGLIKYARVD